MDAKFLAGHKVAPAARLPPCHRPSSSHKRVAFPVYASISRPKLTANDDRETLTAVDRRDSWLDRVAINHLTRAVRAATGPSLQVHYKGMEKKKEDYEGLLEATRHVARSLEPTRQHEVISRALHRAFPTPILAMAILLPLQSVLYTTSFIKALLPVNSKFSREVSAAFSSIFFVWLVGPSEVGESEIHGRREKNILHVKKCRFLEGSNCAGMCVNLCKFPTQKFIKDSIGVPVTFVPNFEDMSCKMIFGEEPPSPRQDPASSQPCYKLCEISKRHDDKKCST